MAWSDCCSRNSIAFRLAASCKQRPTFILRVVIRRAACVTFRVVSPSHIARPFWLRSQLDASLDPHYSRLCSSDRTGRQTDPLAGSLVAPSLMCWHSTHISSRPASSAQRSLEYTCYDTCTCERSSVRRAEPGRAPVNCSFCCCSER